MVSSHSQAEIKRRALAFLSKKNPSNFIGDEFTQELLQFLHLEYESIPEKERIGKGMVYITKVLGTVLYDVITQALCNTDKFKSTVIRICGKWNELAKHGGEEKYLVYLSAQLASRLALDDFDVISNLVLEWATDPEWDVREIACYPVISGLKKHKKKTIAFLHGLVNSPDENIRRVVAESTRPKAEIRWLRDPDLNGPVLELLTAMNHDASIYVRKSVGNNLKDLTKYMPDHILDLVESWLSSAPGLPDKDQKNLMWTIFQGLRWLKEKEQAYHERVAQLVGWDYVYYFDEKKNRNARPKDC